MVRSSEGEPGSAPRAHRYELFEAGRSIGWLEWRAQPREQLGWYLRRHGASPVRLSVDLAIDDLAAGERRDPRGCERRAELAALLSTALALDAAERALHPRPREIRHRLLSRRDTAHYQIYASELDSCVLAHAVPELPVASVADIVMLEGQLTQAGMEAVIRRIQLLGGRVLAVLPTGSQP